MLFKNTNQTEWRCKIITYFVFQNVFKKNNTKKMKNVCNVTINHTRKTREMSNDHPNFRI